MVSDATLPAAGPLKVAKLNQGLAQASKLGFEFGFRLYTMSFPKEAEDAGTEGFISRPSETPHPSSWLTISRRIITQKSNFLQHSLSLACSKENHLVSGFTISSAVIYCAENVQGVNDVHSETVV